MNHRRPSLLPGLLALAVLLACRAPLSGQGVNDDGVRVGIGVAGTGLLSLIVEYRWGHTAVEAHLSTFSFQDLGLYGGGRVYLGGASPQPVVGLGLWGLVAGGDRTGAALVLRAPIGIDVNVGGPSYVGFNIALNRALAVRRADPADTAPPNPRLVPLPGLDYRYRAN